MNIKSLLILTGTLCLGLTITIMMLLLLSTPARMAHAAGPWYVAPEGSDGNSCLSTAAPCATINGAIGKALGGDTIYVANGIYTGTTEEEVVSINKGVTLSGGWNASFTTQSGTSTIDGEDSRRGIYVNDNVTTTVDNFNIQNSYDNGDGGGISSEGTLTLTRSTVSYNYAGWIGGGIAVVNGSSANIIDTRIFSNTTGERGGGIAVWDGSSVNINGARIYANTAVTREGGGIMAESGHLNISSSWVVGNAAPDNDAGGICLGGEGGSAYIENSIIAGNTSEDSAGGLQFGPGGPYHIVNSHIVGNHSVGPGSAIATYAPIEVILTNTLVISNTGDDTGFDDIYGSGTVFLLSYCDTYGNSPDGTWGVTITRTNCLGTPPKDGLDPLMAGGALPNGVGPDYAAEWMSYDYRLLPGSPAIDAGTPIGVPTTDIEGTPRDDIPDMGAYEFEWAYHIFLPLANR
jgi:hypothetical protein